MLSVIIVNWATSRLATFIAIDLDAATRAPRPPSDSALQIA